jgi:hypothetical protein
MRKFFGLTIVLMCLAAAVTYPEFMERFAKKVMLIVVKTVLVWALFLIVYLVTGKSKRRV